MKLSALAVIGACFITITALAQTNSYTVVINPGYTSIANQLNHGGNTLSEVLGGVPVNTVVYRYLPGIGFGGGAVFTDGQSWYDNDDASGTGGSTNGPTLLPGQGAVIFNPTSTPFPITFSGTANTPTLPLALDCGQFYFLSRQTNGLGTFENITGLSPEDGSQVYIYDVNSQGDFTDPFSYYQEYVFSGGGWVPSVPVADVGQSMFIRQPCYNPCLTVSQSDIVFTSLDSTPSALDLAPAYSHACGGSDTNFVTLYMRPGSGTLFQPGTTPVHCVAVDRMGNAASCDFKITVTPPPISPVMTPVNLFIEPGSNLIAFPIITGGNTLNELLSDLPDACVVSKYDNATSSWIQSVYHPELGSFVPPNITLKPGEGAFLYSTTQFEHTIFGAPYFPVLPVSLTNDIFLISCQTNITASSYQLITGTDPLPGTTVYRWLPSQTYVKYTYDGLSWSPNFPTFNVGESLWISPTGNATPPGVPNPPAIITQPDSVATSQGDDATFSVTATGDTPLRYQWRLNGNPVIGATNATLQITNVQPANCGNYDVLVQNLIGIADSSVVSLTISNALLLPFADYFSDAGSLPNTASGFGTGSNIYATFEFDEISPDYIPGGASVWSTWTAPTNGVATFSTAGSGFDTLLAIYTGTNLAELVPIAADDDTAGFLWSEASFNAVAGTTYVIQVDGFYGVMGSIMLSWNLQATSNQLPVIAAQPHSQTVGTGGTATFTVSVQPGTPVTYQWLQNGQPVSGATSSTLTITNVDVPQVGVYQAQITSVDGQLAVLTFPVQLQINVPDLGQPVNTEARAEAKLDAVLDQTTNPNNPYDPPTVSGYTGTQIFSSYRAGLEPNDPLPCGVTCFNTVWHSCMSPNGGLIYVSNTGTGYAGVLSVYTLQYGVLVPLACSIGHGAGNEVVSFQAQGGVTYSITMSSTNANVSGTVAIHYSVASPPSFTQLPVSQTVSAGGNVTLSVATSGSAPISYQWQLNGTNIPGATSSSLHLNPPGDNAANFQAANQGNYSVLATNPAGSSYFMFTPVYLNSSLQFVNARTINGLFFTQLAGQPNSNYLFQASSDHVNWQTLLSGSSATGLINFSDSVNPNYTNLFYRAQLQVIP